MTSSALRTVIIDADESARAAVRRALTGINSIIVVAEYAEVSPGLLAAPAHHVDVLIVGIGEDATPIERLARALPNTAILAMGPVTSAEFVIKTIRAGAVEFLSRPVERGDLEAALEKLVRVRRGVAPQQRSARVTSVFSTKGGLGATTLAINLAVCLAEKSLGQTLLLELDTRPSDVATFLDLKPSYSVLDALGNLSRLDESFLHGLLIKHESGLAVLPGPVKMERADLDAEHVQAVLEILRSQFDHIVLDLRHDLDPGTIAGLEASDVILYLTSPNVAALRSSAAGLAALRHLGLDLRRVRAVLMREGTGEDVTLKHVQEALEIPIYWKTPSDYGAVVAAINHGRPVVSASPRSKIAANLRQLSEALDRTRVPAAPEAKRASLLSLVWSQKGATGAN
jgi:pilus assembly protein CpaE